jgi:hypothetical protein
MPKSQQGQQAVFDGHALEEEMEALIRQAGYVHVANQGRAPEIPWYRRRWRGHGLTNLWGYALYVDFYLWHPRRHPQGFIVDMKLQSRSGSTCEKLAWTVWSLKEVEVPALLLLIGGGFKPGALQRCLAEQEPGRFYVRHHDQGYLEELTRGFL